MTRSSFSPPCLPFTHTKIAHSNTYLCSVFCSLIFFFFVTLYLTFWMLFFTTNWLWSELHWSLVTFSKKSLNWPLYQPNTWHLNLKRLHKQIIWGNILFSESPKYTAYLFKALSSPLCMLSYVWLFMTPGAVAHQAPLSMGFSRQEYWSGLPFPSPDLPHVSCMSCIGRQILYHWTIGLPKLSCA